MGFFVIMGGVYLAVQLLNKSYTAYKNTIKRKLKNQELNVFFETKFDFYQLLSKKEKSKFIRRVNNFREVKKITISDDISDDKEHVKLFVCAAFTQITFGYSNYLLSSFSEVIVRPETFYSKLVGDEVKGLTLGQGYIFYSWKDFKSGYKNGTNKINLALHELAHALYIERFHKVNDPQWKYWEYCAKQDLKREILHERKFFFREYGRTNLNEFWAVCIESFFEDPVNFGIEHPNLYQATSKLLQQDILKRYLSV